MMAGQGHLQLLSGATLSGLRARGRLTTPEQPMAGGPVRNRGNHITNSGKWYYKHLPIWAGSL
jgi:hypothetical protein